MRTYNELDIQKRIMCENCKFHAQVLKATIKDAGLYYKWEWKHREANWWFKLLKNDEVDKAFLKCTHPKLKKIVHAEYRRKCKHYVRRRDGSEDK